MTKYLPLNLADVQKLYWLLGFDKENISETRCLTPEGKVASREYQQDVVGFVNWARRFNGNGNCYVGRTPRKLLERGAVSRISSVTLDLDPIRENKQPATQQQIQETVEAANAILRVYKGGSLALSGNGCLLLWTTDSPLVEDYSLFPKRAEWFQDECRGLIKQYKGVRIDNTHDHQRLIRLIGSTNVKAAGRLSRFLRVSSSRGEGKRVFELVRNAPAGGHLDKSANGVSDTGPATGSELYGEGRRNAYLTSIAGSLRRRGTHPLAIEAALQVENEKHCSPPLDRGEVSTIAESVGRYKPSSPPTGASQILGGTNGKVYKVYTGASYTDEYLKGLEERGKVKELELPTGFTELDTVTGGLRRGGLYILGAHTKTGKTSYILNAVHHLLLRGKSVLYFSTEMGKREITDRLFSVATQVSASNIEKGQLDEKELGKIQGFAERFRSLNLSIFDGFSPNLDMVKSVTLDVKPDVLVFDHIQHIDNGEEVKALASFIKGLGLLCKEANCAGVVASQLRRPMRMMDTKNGQLIYPEPSLFDLRGSSALECEATAILMLHRTGESVDSGVDVVKTKIVANRFGPQHEGVVLFNGSTVTFKELKANG